jgi:ubiquinone/menaquinone biosynthesis C-methylase UbiE
MANRWDDRSRQLRLLSPERERLFPRARVLELLALSEGMTVVDVGAGGGYLEEELAIAVGRAGRVVAIDPSPRARELLLERFQNDAHRQVVVQEGTAGATGLPAGSVHRMVWMALYHELLDGGRDPDGDRQGLYEARRVLRPGGRLVVVDWRPGAPGFGPPGSERVDAEVAAARAVSAGFSVAARADVSEVAWALALDGPGSSLDD